MGSKTQASFHLAPNLNQVRLALIDCARQLRYTVRNVPGAEDSSQTASTYSGDLPRPLPHLLGSVGHIADSLLETAEKYAGQAIPPLQDLWKLPVDFDVQLDRLLNSPEDLRLIRHYSAIYYAAAKRFILNTGAQDVLIFEHCINDALSEFSEGDSTLLASATPQVTSQSDGCRNTPYMFAKITLSLVTEKHPIRSARFGALPNVIAPWWLVSEPNSYVFLTLGLIGCTKAVCPASLSCGADEIVRLAADVIGSKQSRFQDIVHSRDVDMLEKEFVRVTRYL